MRYFLLPASLVLMLSCNAFAEETGALPPPETKAETPASVSPGSEADVKESAPNLNEELSAPDSDVAIDIRSYQRKDGAKITEYAVHGRVFKIKVQPAGDLPAYYLEDRDGDGSFEQRLPGGGKRISPPTWVLQEF